MVTPRDIIELALDDAGVVGEGQTASARWMNNGLTRMNFLLGQWNVRRGLIFRLVTLGVVSSGAQSYTLGPNGDIDTGAGTVRPDRLEAAFVRELTQMPPNQVDTPLDMILAREDYDRLAMKLIVGAPSAVWYDPTYPLGTVYPWPRPEATTYGLYVTIKDAIEKFANLADEIVLPEEYYNGLLYNLSVAFRSAADLPAKPVSVQLARSALNIIRGANTSVPLLQMPSSLRGGARYNVFSDQAQ